MTQGVLLKRHHSFDQTLHGSADTAEAVTRSAAGRRLSVTKKRKEPRRNNTPLRKMPIGPGKPSEETLRRSNSIRPSQAVQTVQGNNPCARNGQYAWNCRAVIHNSTIPNAALLIALA